MFKHLRFLVKYVLLFNLNLRFHLLSAQLSSLLNVGGVALLPDPQMVPAGEPATEGLPEGIDNEYRIRHTVKLGQGLLGISGAGQVFQQVAGKGCAKTPIGKGYVGNISDYSARVPRHGIGVDIQADIARAMGWSIQKVANAPISPRPTRYQ